MCLHLSLEGPEIRSQVQINRRGGPEGYMTCTANYYILTMLHTFPNFSQNQHRGDFFCFKELESRKKEIILNWVFILLLHTLD